jgi:signal transduction histidine kinase
MLAGVSHDLRTPISRLRFALELYGEGATPRLLAEVTRENYEEPSPITTPQAAASASPSPDSKCASR